MYPYRVPEAVSEDGSVQVQLLDDGDVPLVTFAVGTQLVDALTRNISWMLQFVVDTPFRKASNLCEIYVNDDRLEQETSELGLAKHEICIAVLRSCAHPPYKAIGVNGKASAYFGLILRLGMEGQLGPTFKHETSHLIESTILIYSAVSAVRKDEILAYHFRFITYHLCFILITY